MKLKDLAQRCRNARAALRRHEKVENDLDDVQDEIIGDKVTEIGVDLDLDRRMLAHRATLYDFEDDEPEDEPEPEEDEPEPEEAEPEPEEAEPETKPDEPKYDESEIGTTIVHHATRSDLEDDDEDESEPDEPKVEEQGAAADASEDDDEYEPEPGAAAEEGKAEGAAVDEGEAEGAAGEEEA